MSAVAVDVGAVDVDAVVEGLDAQARAAGSPERAAQEARYLKSELAFYGISVPFARSAVRRLRRDQPALGRSGAIAVAERLWDEPAESPVHDRRLLAALILSTWEPQLRARDLPLLDRLVREARTWALVDVLACDVSGPLTDRLGPGVTPVLDRWAADGDFWVRRLALLSHERPLRAGGGDWHRFAGYADAMLAEREFFIRKAIGWVLRSTSRRRPDLVFDWLEPRAARASGVTLREAVKYLSPEQARAVQAAGKASS
jgi:3-methyladenine DNA glycosylase AlkD